MGSPAENRIIYRFEPYEVDAARCELRKFGHRIRLERKPWLLLLVLLEKRGAVVTRGELQAALWPDGTFVDFEHGLYVAVKKLRAALCDSLDSPRFIETVAREGYRFIAPVEEAIDDAPGRRSARIGLAAGAPVAPADEEISEAPRESGSPVPAPVPASQRWSRFTGVTVSLAIVLGIAVLSVGVARLRSRTLQESRAANPGRVMLVVLPFENLGGHPDEEYLSDGITEELSVRLSNLNPQRLGVIGRTSAMTYKHSPRTIRQIGSDLGVAYVLEGSVRRDGSRIRVTAQLVDVADQAHVWSESYDQDMHGLLAVEDEIGFAIARQVGIKIALEPRDQSQPAHVPNAEAHEAYLIGLYYRNKRTPEGWAEGEKYFRRAIKEDPEFADAYAGLATCRGVSRQEAVAAARRAVQLDPSSVEARTALGWVDMYREWNFVEAEGTFRTAAQLGPGYAPVHHTYSDVLALGNRLNEAIAEEEQAVRIDPLSLISRANLASLLSVAGQHDRAVEQLRQALAIDPRYPKTHEALGCVYLRRRMYKEAIAEFEVSQHYGGSWLPGLTGYAYARAGQEERALRLLTELKKLDKRSPSGDLSSELALVEIGLGKQDAAMTWLEKEYEQHDDDGPWAAKVDPIYEPLRSLPRFRSLMERVTFPQ